MKKELCDLSRTVVQRARHCRRANPDERANARERPKHLRRELCRRGRCHFDFVSSLPFNSPLTLCSKQIIALISGLSNEMLCVLVAQGAAKLRKVKAGGQKNLTFWVRSFALSSEA